MHDLPARTAIMEAMLATAGELGYREVAIQQVLERYGGHRVQFWQRFASKEDCFAAACATEIDRLTTELLADALAAGDWRRGVRAALVGLFRFVERNPAVARALLIEAEIAGGDALAKREEAIQRLGGAIDSAREQIAAEERPPPLTGVFIAGGIANYVSEQLAAGTPAAIWQGLPELMRFATGPYLGEEAADAEFESARAFLDRLPEEGR
ncbi:MAG: TetR/AcrR family transcriptional regulator [Solirubrobacterales bacterium]